MLRLATLSVTNAIEAEFSRCFTVLWTKLDRPLQIGLAISGGVDSMALAGLCNQYKSVQNGQPQFTAFVIDHDIRQNSAAEAAATAQELQRLGIATHISKLKWSAQDSERSTNLETVARRLRYQALGNLCRLQGIEHLLFAHHADDQAETVLYRLFSGYTGPGLRGMKPSAEIPECFGIHGVSRSGRPRTVNGDIKSMISDSKSAELSAQSKNAMNLSSNPVQIEAGGVQIHRPLLGFSKSHLYQFCRDKNVTWSEDKTNQDPTLTLRNTVRSLLRSERLPMVLRTLALQQTATSCSSKDERHEETAARIFQACKISLNNRSGYAVVRFPVLISNMLTEGLDQGDNELTAQRSAACLIRRLAMLVTPLSDISLREVQAATRISFPHLFEGDQAQYSNRVTFSKVVFTIEDHAPDRRGNLGRARSTVASPEAGLPCTIFRAPPERKETQDLRCEKSRIDEEGLDSWISPWSLFDGRFWIRFSRGLDTPGPEVTTCVRFLTSDDARNLNKRWRQTDTLRNLVYLLRKHAPGKIRFTLPAIIERRSDPVSGVTSDHVVALPSLNWSCLGWQQYDYGHNTSSDICWWEIRYKKIDLDGNREGKHKVFL